jgi:hypothetical protein
LERKASNSRNMGSDGPGEDPIDAFTEWALSRGVTLNGIAAHRFPGRGVGIVAESKIEVCTILYPFFPSDGSEMFLYPVPRVHNFNANTDMPFMQTNIPHSLAKRSYMLQYLFYGQNSPFQRISPNLLVPANRKSPSMAFSPSTSP